MSDTYHFYRSEGWLERTRGDSPLTLEIWRPGKGWQAYTDVAEFGHNSVRITRDDAMRLFPGVNPEGPSLAKA